MASTVLEATTTCVHVAGGRDSFPNSVAVSDLPLLIQNGPGALNGLDEADEPKVKQEPAVSIRSSVKPDYIVCLEDGKKMKMLRRHLATDHGMTPHEYRAKWNLPKGYPIVAPSYRSEESRVGKEWVSEFSTRCAPYN